jgi:hypothetical protein
MNGIDTEVVLRIEQMLHLFGNCSTDVEELAGKRRGVKVAVAVSIIFVLLAAI